MSYFQRSGNRYKIRFCKECSKEFIPIHHGSNKQFCTYSCSNKFKWRSRERKPEKIRIKKCLQCNNDFKISSKYSVRQWYLRKFCSLKCFHESKIIRDGLKNAERSRRKRGILKKFTPEWLEKIRAKTTEAMYRPEVNAKLRKPRRSMSLEARIHHSNMLAGKLPKNMMFGANNNMGMFKNIQRGEYETSKGLTYFRSKWEANYALYLDFLVARGEIERWEYEADVFMFEEIKLGTRSYRPDFKVFNKNGSFEYHEVKGYMDNKSKTKLKRMAKYYPEVRLILIDSDYYNDLKKKVGKMLKFY